jgi:hypothetical protein
MKKKILIALTSIAILAAVFIIPASALLCLAMFVMAGDAPETKAEHLLIPFSILFPVWALICAITALPLYLARNGFKEKTITTKRLLLVGGSMTPNFLLALLLSRNPNFLWALLGLISIIAFLGLFILTSRYLWKNLENQEFLRNILLGANTLTLFGIVVYLFNIQHSWQGNLSMSILGVTQWL